MTDEGQPCGVVLRLVSFSFCYVKGRRRRSKPVSFSLLEKERFLESKEKGAPVWVEWSQIVIRRPGFTPPLRTSTVHRRLRRWNRDKLWSYPTFFRRLRGWGAGRGSAACIPYSRFTFPSSFSLWGAASQTRLRHHAAKWGRGGLWPPAGLLPNRLTTVYLCAMLQVDKYLPRRWSVWRNPSV